MDYQLDLRSYLCPLPLLMTKKALVHLKQGDRLNVLLNDKSSVADFELLCQQYGYKLRKQKREEENICLNIEK